MNSNIYWEKKQNEGKWEGERELVYTLYLHSELIITNGVRIRKGVEEP